MGKLVPWNNINTQPNQGHRRSGGRRKHNSKTCPHNFTNAENQGLKIKTPPQYKHWISNCKNFLVCHTATIHTSQLKQKQQPLVLFLLV
ncbi:hypothetical protein L195_g027103 [Trifolium pratense]|uniref:Uncharacterized protein n=1 Tax=Trifolium pratense TaxID=57577 RepID=A0A2K3KY71_TRIPR|nr:hypothetical protein L195_g027103 [Trifolium pratense]